MGVAATASVLVGNLGLNRGVRDSRWGCCVARLLSSQANFSNKERRTNPGVGLARGLRRSDMQRERLVRYRWYLLDAVQLMAVGLTALALLPTGAHLFEMAGTLRLTPADYMTVQSVRHGGVLFAVAALFATAAVGLHTFLVRRNASSFGWSIVALAGVGAAQIVFWGVGYPANAATENWSALPIDFDAARRQWEYAFAAAGVFSFAGLLAFVRAIEASRPFASLSILESIERDAAVRAARMRALSIDGAKRPLERALSHNKAA